MINFDSINYNHYLHKTYEERLNFFSEAYGDKQNIKGEQISELEFYNKNFTANFCYGERLIHTCFYIPKDKTEQTRVINNLEGILTKEDKNGNSSIKMRYIIDRKKQKYFDSRYTRLYWRPYYIKSMLFIVTFLEEKFNLYKLTFPSKIGISYYIHEPIIHHFLSSLSIKSEDDGRDHQNLLFLSSESYQIVHWVICAYEEFITLLVNPMDDVTISDSIKRFVETHPSKCFTELQNTLIKNGSTFSTKNISNLYVLIFLI